MARATVVRYTTHAEAAEENARLVRAVYAELASEDPGGLTYATFRLDDDVSFVHVAILEGDDNPLTRSKAFAAFQESIAERCLEPPVARSATVVGSYRLGSD